MNTIKFTAGLIIVVIALILVPAIFAQEGPIEVSIPENVDAVNVRSGPGIEFTVRGVLQKNTVATGRNGYSDSRVCRGLMSDLNMWVRVDFNGIEGWVNRCAVNLTSTPNALPVVDASNPVLILPQTGHLIEPDGESTKNAPDTTYLIGFTRDSVNVRAAPGLGAEIMTVAPFEEDIFVVGRSADNNWLKVMYNGEAGWIASYLMLMPRNWQTTLPVQ